MEYGTTRTSFLSKLLAKKARTLDLAANGIHVQSALDEVDRQIAQALAGNIISGEGVTKSGGDDFNSPR